MDPVSLEGIAAALMARALVRTEDGVLNESAIALRRVLGFVRQYFADRSDTEGTRVLDRLADAPDSATRVEALTTLLSDRVMHDPTFRGDLECVVEQARAAGVDIDSISQIAVGDGNVQIAGLNDSSVRVTSAGPSGQDQIPGSAG